MFMATRYVMTPGTLDFWWTKKVSDTFGEKAYLIHLDVPYMSYLKGRPKPGSINLIFLRTTKDSGLVEGSSEEKVLNSKI